MARNDQMLTGTDLRRAGDAVGFHKDRHRHAVPLRQHFKRLARGKSDGRTAFPGPGRGRRRGRRQRPGDVRIAGLIRAHAVATARDSIAGIAGKMRERFAVDVAGARRNGAGRLVARRGYRCRKYRRSGRNRCCSWRRPARLTQQQRIAAQRPTNAKRPWLLARTQYDLRANRHRWGKQGFKYWDKNLMTPEMW